MPKLICVITADKEKMINLSLKTSKYIVELTGKLTVPIAEDINLSFRNKFLLE